MSLWVEALQTVEYVCQGTLHSSLALEYLPIWVQLPTIVYSDQRDVGEETQNILTGSRTPARTLPPVFTKTTEMKKGWKHKYIIDMIE